VLTTSGTYLWSFVTQILYSGQPSHDAEHLSSLPVFSGVRVIRSLVLYICFVDHCLSFCSFSFGHCVVCSSKGSEKVLTTSGTYLWSFVTQILYSGQPSHDGDRKTFEVMTST
jgi:hypothetical protein